MRNILVTAIVLLLSVFNSFAQSADGVEMAEALRSSGKIYVVVAVLAAILLVLVFYLFSIDRRVKKLENQD
ncbi:CcmD family protein [Pedobacter sp. SYSU D00535]|uniref:CcmD family protein n=1 Tax=Pedobacter sp. SYSU D00535 TaxID=2810308 RepID=UPI001A974470|nr:CcmD family protein [Pedobacter sp. SYSU D00535]